MADYDRNAAYDLSRFAPAEVKTAPGTKEVRRPDKPEIVQEKIKTARERRNEKRRRQLLLRRTVFVGATLLMLAGLRLSGEVQVAQLDKEIKQQTALLEDARSEGIRLDMDIERSFSFDEVQLFIQQTGMQKSDSKQIINLDIEKQDKVVKFLGNTVK